MIDIVFRIAAELLKLKMSRCFTTNILKNVQNVTTVTFFQKMNRRNRIYQLKYLKEFLKTVSQNVKNK